MTIPVAVTARETVNYGDINGDNGSDSKHNSDGDSDLNDEKEKYNYVSVLTFAGLGLKIPLLKLLRTPSIDLRLKFKRLSSVMLFLIFSRL